LLAWTFVPLALVILMPIRPEYFVVPMSFLTVNAIVRFVIIALQLITLAWASTVIIYKNRVFKSKVNSYALIHTKRLHACCCFLTRRLFHCRIVFFL
jgi:hypothetical protein